jgi:hypothetical protein
MDATDQTKGLLLAEDVVSLRYKGTKIEIPCRVTFSLTRSPSVVIECEGSPMLGLGSAGQTYQLMLLQGVFFCGVPDERRRYIAEVRPSS